MVMSKERAGSTVARPGALTALKVVAHIIPLFILVQAFMAGRYLIGNQDIIEMHGMIGETAFLLAIVQFILVFVAGLSGRERRALLGTAAALIVLMLIQIGLGYGGRDPNEARAWHIPTGVLIFGLSVFNVSAALRAGK